MYIHRLAITPSTPWQRRCLLLLRESQKAHWAGLTVHATGLMRDSTDGIIIIIIECNAMPLTHHTLTHTISPFHPPHRTPKYTIIPIPLWAPPRRTRKPPPPWLTHIPTAAPTVRGDHGNPTPTSVPASASGWSSFSTATRAGVLVGAIAISLCLLVGVYVLWCQQWGWWMKSAQIRVTEATEEGQVIREATRLTVLREGGWWGRALEQIMYATGRGRDREKKRKKKVRWDLGRKTLKKRKRKSITEASVKKRPRGIETEDSQQGEKKEDGLELGDPSSSEETGPFSEIFNRQVPRRGELSGGQEGHAKRQRWTSAFASESKSRRQRRVTQRRVQNEPQYGDGRFDSGHQVRDCQNRRPLGAQQCNRRRIMPFFSPEASSLSSSDLDTAHSTSMSQHRRTGSSAIDSLGEAWMNGS